jgi:hypothetical protein
MAWEKKTLQDVQKDGEKSAGRFKSFQQQQQRLGCSVALLWQSLLGR